MTIMAKVISTEIKISVSKLVSNKDKGAIIDLPKDLADNLESVVSELLGDGFIVEANTDVSSE